MLDSGKIDIPLKSPGFYVFNGEIRYFHDSTVTKTLTREEPLVIDGSTFSFGCVHRNEGIVDWVYEDVGVQQTHLYEVHLYAGHVTSVGNQILWNPFSCWGIQNGLPAHAFVPEPIDEGDSYFLLLQEIQAIDRNLLESLELLELKKIEELARRSLAYIRGESQEPPKVLYPVMAKGIDRLIKKYRTSIWISE